MTNSAIDELERNGATRHLLWHMTVKHEPLEVELLSASTPRTGLLLHCSIEAHNAFDGPIWLLLRQKDDMDVLLEWLTDQSPEDIIQLYSDRWIVQAHSSCPIDALFLLP